MQPQAKPHALEITAHQLRRQRRLALCAVGLAGVAAPALAQTTTPASTDTLSSFLLPVIASVIGGGVTAFLTTSFKLKEFEAQTKLQQSIEKQRQEEKNRIQYLNPLRISAEDLRTRVNEIKDLMMKSDENKQNITNCFKYIEEKNIGNRREFEKWCNIDGYFAMASLYVTAVYFARANKLRSEFPIAQLDPKEDESLLSLLSKVRQSYGGRFGIWETVQDSIGNYARKSDGTIMNYREFCGEIADWDKHVWFRSLIDFYRDYQFKLHDEVPRIQDSLEALITFLQEHQTRKSSPTPIGP